jgi:hypothetical protein
VWKLGVLHEYGAKLDSNEMERYGTKG